MKSILSQGAAKLLLLFLSVHLTFFPAWLGAKPIHSSVAPPGAGALPVLLPGQIKAGWSDSAKENNYYQINQTDPRVVIQWESFDVGEQAHMHFEQGSGSALNRVLDPGASPSRIFGQLTATGNIYLVNQNGILFGKNSRVNLNSLVASSLNISNDDFLAQTIQHKYQAQNYKGDSNYMGAGGVSNRGNINVSEESRIFLLAPSVENSGTLSAPKGTVYLAGGEKFDVETTIVGNAETGNFKKEVMTTDYSGNVQNVKGGNIYADVGKVGMFGRIVQNDGLIRSLSTIRKGSSIKLVASQSVSTGAGSRIDSGVMEEEGLVLTSAPFAGRELIISKPEIQTDPILITHEGQITMPSGTVTMDTGDGGRIYLGSKSQIDVSGSWANDLTAEEKIMTAQLNSLELRDEFLQKNGILKGKTIYYLPHEGVGIGNISEHLKNRPLSVLEQSTQGGIVELKTGHGEVIMDSGASIDISGGGTGYTAGWVQTTKLLSSEGELYDIADAPDWLTYTEVINPGDPRARNLKTYLPGHIEGADAGTLKVEAKQAVLDGNLSAAAQKGVYQVNIEDPVNDLGYLKAVGTRIPESGTFILGEGASGVNYFEYDLLIDAIKIKSQVPAWVSESRNGETWLSENFLSNSGLGAIELNANKSILTESGTDITLAAGGSFKATARSVVHKGSITVPAGEVELTLKSNKTTDIYAQPANDPEVANPDYISLDALGGPERIELAAGSSISTAGERINAFGKDVLSKTNGIMDGGSVRLRDQTKNGEGVMARAGSSIDVGGGYLIGTKGRLLDAGDAGTLTIQGTGLVLDGELAGLSMVGKKGGTAILYARQTQVSKAPGADLPEGYSTEDFVMDDNRFDDTGFSNITLGAFSDVSVDSNVTLAPSQTKLAVGRNGRVEKRRVPLELVGESSLHLEAGLIGEFGAFSQGFDSRATLTVGKNASLTVAPGGTITLSGQSVDLSGRFVAPSGTITVNTKSALDMLPLLVRKNARFDVSGYNRDTGNRIIGDQIVWAPENGGEVSFSSNGKLIMEKGSLIDVSGAAPVTLFRNTGFGRLQAYQAASAPGTITLSFFNAENQDSSTTLRSTYRAARYQSGLAGGSFNIRSLDTTDEYLLSKDILSSLESSGFDSLGLSSRSKITFDGTQTLEMARGISIDTPVLAAGQDAQITLNTRYLSLLNSTLPGQIENLDADATFTVNAGFIDMEGDIKTDGFSLVALNAEQDMRLTDRIYTDNQSTKTWVGHFATQGDLVLKASRIYPTTASEFTITAKKDITILSSGVTRTDPIYSALGKLTLEAENINHQGFVAAPMGQVNMIAQERVYLAPESTISVSGETSVKYGVVDETNLKWYGYYENGIKTTIQNKEITSLPEKQINIEGDQVIGMTDSNLNMEGGGLVYGNTFLSGLDGSLDPLSELTNRFVIVPGSMGNLPGKAVYLEGNDLLAAGVYTLLPEAYAFLDNAMIIERQGSVDPLVFNSLSNEGYTMAVGYDAVKQTGQRSSVGQWYTVRRAKDVLTQGHYETKGLSAGDAGALNISAPTNIFNSTVRATALNSDYRPGVLELSGQRVIAGAKQADLGRNFNFNTRFEDDPDLAQLIGSLYLDASKLSAAGLWEINIGNEATTQTITFEENARLVAPKIGLTAQNDILLKEGAGIEAVTDAGQVSLLSTTGKVRLEKGSSITSSFYVGIDAAGLERNGNIEAGSIIDLKSDYLYLSDAASQSALSTGLVVDEAFWKSFDTLDEVWLSGREEIGYAGDVTLNPGHAIVLDTPLVANVSQAGGETLTLDSRDVFIYNSQADKVSQDTYADNKGKLDVQADQITLGPGSVGFSGFENLNLDSKNNLTLVGKGTVNTYDTNLDMVAAKVTGQYRWVMNEANDGYEYEALDFNVNAGTGKMTISRSTGLAQENDTVGGKMTFTANTIENSGTVDLESGVIHFKSDGSTSGEGIFMNGGAQVTAENGGMVFYEADNASITLAGESVTRAGTIAVKNPNGVFTVDRGTFDAASESYVGGTSLIGDTFLMDTSKFKDISSLVSILSDGGFSQQVDMRVRQGNVNMASGIATKNFRLSADTGDIAIDALIDASGTTDGGKIGIFAGKKLTLSEETQLRARGDQNGGAIHLASGVPEDDQKNTMDLGGATLDVSATGKNGKGGTVYLRAPRIKGDSDIGLTMNATLTGASKVDVEAYKIYEDANGKISSSETGTWNTDATNFMNAHAASMVARLLGEVKNSADNPIGNVSLAPGIEVQSIGDLSLDTRLDLTSWRFGPDGVAPVITLRAGRDLIINNDILDHPTHAALLNKETAKASSRINLAAGATLASSDVMAVEDDLEEDQGNLTIKAGKKIYTEGGDINFASAGNTRIELPGSGVDYMTLTNMTYNMASYTGNISGSVGKNLVLDGGIVQTATGDIDLDIKGSLHQQISQDSIGTIRTLGQPATIDGLSPVYAQYIFPEKYHSGGDISIKAGEDVVIMVPGKDSHLSFLNPEAWYALGRTYEMDEDPPNPRFPVKEVPGVAAFAAYYGSALWYGSNLATQGIAAMGGGDVSIVAGGDVFGQIGTFGTGDLSVLARGDLNGWFLNKKGTATLDTYGSYGTISKGQVIEIFDTQLNLNAQGDINLASVSNPTITSNIKIKNFTRDWNLTYTPDTSVSLKSYKGSVAFNETADPVGDKNVFFADKTRILPANVSIAAARDIVIGKSLTLAPSATGQLQLQAGRDIISNDPDRTNPFSIVMSDLAPEQAYGAHEEAPSLGSTVFSSDLHENDRVPAVIEAGGNISNLEFVLPKSASIIAGGDIENINYIGQNMDAADVTQIIAGGDIVFPTRIGETQSFQGIAIHGPGLSLISAGNTIDLGTSAGISSLGNSGNPSLESGANDLMVLAGVSGVKDLSVQKMTLFFDELRQAGKQFIQARENADEALAQKILADVRTNFIVPMMGEPDQSRGDINLVNSRIYTRGGAGTIFALAKGQVNVGISTIKPPPIVDASTVEAKDSGFYTAGGGAIKMFAGGDINVNESRIMTFDGGDIDIWSDRGNVNAGRGSKAAFASTRKRYEQLEDGSYKEIFEPPAIGSGIRATALDIDDAGDIYVTAPEGDIDAGEAGIAGRNVTLAAERVLNAQNIQSTGIAFGFTKPSDSSADIAGFSGSGGLAENTLLNEDASSFASAMNRMTEPLPEGYSVEPKWVDVEVISFEEDEEDEDEDEEDEDDEDEDDEDQEQETTEA